MNFPATIPVEDLEKTSPEYDAKKLALYQAMYDGGSAMEAVKKELLPVRELEKKAGGTSGQHYQDRLARAPYNRATAGFIDWLVAAAFRKPPTIETDAGLSADSAAYYQSLNRSADGRGTPLAAMMRDTVLECVLHRRAYPMFNFPGAEIDPTDPKTGEARFRLLRAHEVEDWSITHDGVLEWIRVHGSEMVRDEAAGWKQATRERHVWLFLTPEGCYEYEAFKKDATVKGGGTWEVAPGHGAKAEARLTKSTSWADLPVSEVRYRTGQWIMETCFDTAQALFIRDSSIEYLADKFAFQILVLTMDRVVDDKILLPDMGAVHLRAGESIGFIAPSTQVLTPLFESAKKLKDDLLNSIHASAQNAASIPQAGRLSGEAVNAMRDPLNILLYSFAWPVLDAWNRVLEKIIAVRGDPPGCARIVGMDEFDAQESDLEDAIYGKGRGVDGDIEADGGDESDAEGSGGASLQTGDERGSDS